MSTVASYRWQGYLAIEAKTWSPFPSDSDRRDPRPQGNCFVCSIVLLGWYTGATPVVRSDDGLIYQSRRFRAACRDYRLTQEFITLYTPEQNGMIERFFRSVKEECGWQHSFGSFAHARRERAEGGRWVKQERPHQALGYRSRREFRAREVTRVA